MVEKVSPSLALLVFQYFSNISVWLRSLTSFLFGDILISLGSGYTMRRTGYYSRRHLLQVFSMPPCSSKPPITQRNQNSHGNHTSMTSPFLFARLIDECAQASMRAIVNKVDKIVGDGMQTGRQRLILDETLEFELQDGLFPGNCVSGLDVEVNEEQRRNGRQIDRRGGRGGRRDGERRRLASASWSHGEIRFVCS
jgi:hypothetical protein